MLAVGKVTIAAGYAALIATLPPAVSGSDGYDQREQAQGQKDGEYAYERYGRASRFTSADRTELHTPESLRIGFLSIMAVFCGSTCLAAEPGRMKSSRFFANERMQKIGGPVAACTTNSAPRCKGAATEVGSNAAKL